MAIWNPVEALPRDQLEALQLERLRACVARVLLAVAPLAERLRAAGIADAREVSSLTDLRRLPFTTKADLRDHYPFGLLGVPRDQVVRVHASSGTRGKPSVAAYSKHDLGVWNEVMARCMTMAGVRPGMVVHNAYGYGLFTGGLGFHQGAELIGCTVVPISGGFTQRQAMLLRDFGGSVLCATPSYALNIAEELERSSIDPRELSAEAPDVTESLSRRGDVGDPACFGEGVAGDFVERKPAIGAAEVGDVLDGERQPGAAHVRSTSRPQEGLVPVTMTL